MRKHSTHSVENYYALLEVRPNASPEVITAAYRVLMKRFHPDADGGNEKIAKRLNEAHAVLADPSARKAYDRARGSVAGTMIGEFRVLKEIAEGGFGKTYKGEHVLVGEPVCIKHCSRISPQDEAVLIEEARAAWDLRHHALPAMRNLLRLDDDSVALVMSYIPGPTLAQIVEKNGRMNPEHVAWITQRLLNALQYMHFHGVVHGDLKPQNVIIQPQEHHAVLVDFGLAMVKPDGKTGAKGYTDYFAPPEQVRGRPILPESDLYSLGMTMLYALGGNVAHVAKKQVPDSTPDPLCQFIQRLIVTDVLARPRWDKEDLYDSFTTVRKQSFGRSFSNMKPLSWTDEND